MTWDVLSLSYLFWRILLHSKERLKLIKTQLKPNISKQQQRRVNLFWKQTETDATGVDVWRGLTDLPSSPVWRSNLDEFLHNANLWAAPKNVVLCSFKSNLFPLTVCHFAASLHLHWNWQELSWHLDGLTVECTESLTQAGCVLLIKHGSAGPSVPNDSDYMKSTCLWLLLNKWTLGIVLAPLNKIF